MSIIYVNYIFLHLQKWPMRSRLYVSDPVWLYRSGGNQSSGQQNYHDTSPSSESQLSSDEDGDSPILNNSPDLPSPSDSTIGTELTDSQHMLSSCNNSCSQTYYTSHSQPPVFEASVNEFYHSYQEPHYIPCAASCAYQQFVPEFNGNCQ